MRSRPRILAFLAAAIVAAASALAASQAIAQAKKPAPRVDAGTCYGCHAPIREFHAGNKHKGVACASCHDGLDQHLGNASARPVTKTDPAVCGSCHQNQYRTMYNMNWEKTARAEKSRLNGPSPNPSWDKLMMGHGFAREHNIPRSHSFALYDQIVVDRAFGGRFTNKEGWKGLAKPGGNFRVWDVVQDEYPGEDHKAFKPGTAAAANPVCMSCKSADHILDWAYLGDPVPGAKWSRTSKVVDFVKSVNHSLNCYFCHDPHSTQPRVIRDGLIQALTRPEKDTLWHKDPRGAKIEVKDLGVRGYTRKIAILDRYDTNLQCGQCHVEYNCNPGTDPRTGQPVTMQDARTNHFPFKSVNEIASHYDDLGFRDFRHSITGALLWKAQHPDVEAYYGSKHQKAGVECASCHMPKTKDAKTGKVFTSHWQTSPRHYLKETCQQCHGDWSETQIRYVIDSLKNRYDGKVRKAEFWLTRLVDKFEEAQNVGVDTSVLGEARKAHDEAHIHWEFWTAVNGAYFHNPDQANESLNRSMIASQNGIKMLDEAMGKRRGTGTTQTVVPAGPQPPQKPPLQ
jgi:formate-dependent nitrite reductase cytochrome c552 subunit